MTERISYRMAELAHLTGISRAKLYEYAKSGKLKVCKMGSMSLVLAADADAFIATYATPRSAR